MQASNIPSKVPLPFANSGTKNTIPTASQIGITAGAASLTDGFPPLTFTPLASGGVPPAGADFNGILNLITAIQQWQSAGGNFKWDSAFSTSVGGYPKGAVLVNSTNDGMWFNLADNNTTNPDATDGSAANWAPIDAYGATSIALTNANVLLTPAQFSKPIIVLTGTLTGNVQLTMPKLVGTWYVVNSTTGAFTAQILTASGTPLTIAQGGAALVRGDGTNVLNDALAVAPATQSQHAPQFSQVNPGRLLRVTRYRNSGGTLQSSVNGGAYATASSTFTAQALTTAVYVELLGGGGSGGSSQATTTGQYAAGSGGGGGGGCKKWISSGFNGVTVTVGAGGATTSPGSAGNTGGSSSFGSICSATGGAGGSLGTAATGGQGLVGQAGGGQGANGDSNLQGSPGGAASYNASSITSGLGGASCFGGGGAPFSTGTAAGVAATSPGAGGSGGSSGPSNGTGAAGGAAVGGEITVWEYA